MSSGEIAYLSLSIAAFVVYAVLLAYGMLVAGERPAAKAEAPAATASRKAA